MAWIESHQRLRSDPKLRRFCRALGVARPHGIGLLHLLWWFALDHAESGNLASLDRRDLALELDWPEDKADTLWEALTEASTDGEPGFLDANGAIHAWRDYAGRLLGDRDRKRLERAEKAAAAKDALGVHGQSQDRPGKNALDTTQPTNTTNLDKSGTDVDFGFSDFWDYYPRKDKKPDALKAWRQLSPSGAVRSLIAVDVKRRSNSTDWRKEEGKWIPLPGAYIRNRRWGDEGVVLPKPSLVADQATVAHLAARGLS